MKTIVGNCDTILFFGSPDPDTRDYISKALGRQTIQTSDTSQTQGRQGSYSCSRQTQGRALLTPDEVGRLPGNEAIVLVRCLPPFLSRKFAHVAKRGARCHPAVEVDGGSRPRGTGCPESVRMRTPYLDS